MPNNAINSPSLGNIELVGNAILITDNTGQGSLATSPPPLEVVSVTEQFWDYNTPDAILASQTLAPSDILSKLIVVIGASGAVNLDWGTATAYISASINTVDNSTLELLVVNTTAFLVTMTNTTDPTHVGTQGLIGGASATVPALTTRRFRIVITNILTSAIAIFG